MNPKSFRLALIAVTALSAGIAESAEKSASKPDAFGLVTCSTTNESRTLAIATKEGGGCDLHYEKYRKDKVISWSSHDVQPCLNSQKKVRKELEDAGWKSVQDSSPPRSSVLRHHRRLGRIRRVRRRTDEISVVKLREDFRARLRVHQELEADTGHF